MSCQQLDGTAFPHRPLLSRAPGPRPGGPLISQSKRAMLSGKWRDQSACEGSFSRDYGIRMTMQGHWDAATR